MNWLLPEYIADALPREAAHIERVRRACLDQLRTHGYLLVMPPLLEYLESLFTGAGRDLRLRTFELTDQLSGRTMGVRADMTPQITRIDAHLLNHAGVTRLCYCDSVLHALPASATASREPIQLGAELYGYPGCEADIEVVRLMAATLECGGLADFRLDIGHVGIFRALTSAAGIAGAEEEALFAIMQNKDLPALAEALAKCGDPWRSALLRLPELFGGPPVLAHARAALPDSPAIAEALDVLDRLAAGVAGRAPSFDLADLRGYHYHNGVVFAAYCAGFAGPIALGGRYDNVGAAFGRARPATGFSLDLRELARLTVSDTAASAVLAPAGSDARLLARIAELRAAGEIVVQCLPGEAQPELPRCDRELVCRNGDWMIANAH
ncbi:MAG TPA: ATP phosphoribosyltransferase regulatory subunit [Rhodocyclaceae bacterium]